MIKIRLAELGSYIYVINNDESKRDYLNLVATYNLHKRLYNNSINEKNFSLEELKTSLIVSESKTNLKNNFTIFQAPSLLIINSLRFLIGKKSIQNIINNESNQYLDIAYYFERQKLYSKSLAIYNDILKRKNPDQKQKSIINLHEGYCYSIIGDYTNAKEKFNKVINENKNTNISVTAMILLEYLEDFNKEIMFVKNNSKDNIEKGEKLFKLIAFKEAENILDNLAKETQNKDKDKILFYLARCKEETGKTVDALKIYQRVILENPKSEYAKFSNRRMFIVVNSNPNDKLENLIIKNSNLINDNEFIEFTNVKNILKTQKKEKDVLLEKFENENMTEEGNTIEFIDDSLKKVEEKIVSVKNDIKDNSKITKKYKNEFVYLYDKNGKKIKESYYNNLSILDYYEIYEYDKKGAIKKILHFNGKEELLYYHSYTYNEKGEKVSINTYDPFGKILEYY